MKSHLEYPILGTAILFVIGIVVFWAKNIRKTRKRRYEYPKPATSTNTQKAAAQLSIARKQKRRRRRSEPCANPTLAETRGLPPVREDHRAAAGHYRN